jgi:hypothetical protein
MPQTGLADNSTRFIIMFGASFVVAGGAIFMIRRETLKRRRNNS